MYVMTSSRKVYRSKKCTKSVQSGNLVYFSFELLVIKLSYTCRKVRRSTTHLKKYLHE